MIVNHRGGEVMIKTIIRIMAKNPPSIAIAAAVLLALAGQSDQAYAFLVAGILMQSIWIIGKYALSRYRKGLL